MKQLHSLLAVALITILSIGCADKTYHHGRPMPDPASFNAHFGDMDTDNDELVSWEEFQAYFPDANKHVYKALDLNQDGAVDHDEWHEFKEAHGLKHHE